MHGIEGEVVQNLRGSDDSADHSTDIKRDVGFSCGHEFSDFVRPLGGNTTRCKFVLSPCTLIYVSVTNSFIEQLVANDDVSDKR